MYFCRLFRKKPGACRWAFARKNRQTKLYPGKIPVHPMDIYPRKSNNMAKISKGGKVALGVVGGLVGFWAVVLVVLQIVLSPAVLSGIVSKYAGEYIKGADLQFKQIGVSMFKAFPEVELNLDSCTVTYPHEKFDSLIAPDFKIQYMGRGQESDTLAVFDRFEVRINPFALLGWKLSIPDIDLCKPRIFAHTFRDGRSNFDILGESEEASDSTDTSESSFSLPEIVFGGICLCDGPTVVYSDATDTLSALLRFNEASLKGRLSSSLHFQKRFEIGVDSLFAAGRVGSDTLLAGVDYLRIKGRKGHLIDVTMNSRAFLGTSSFGRLEIPISIDGKVDMPKDEEVTTVDFQKLNGSIAYIPFRVTGRVQMPQDSLYVKADVDIDEVPIQTILEKYGKQIIYDDADKVKTDARLTAEVVVDGHYVYENGKLPPVNGIFSVPAATVSVDSTSLSGNIAIDGLVETDSEGRYNLILDNIDITALESTHLGGELDVMDILGDDILLRMDLGLRSQLDTLASLLPEDMGITASGALKGKVEGSVRVSQLEIAKLPKSNLNGYLIANNLRVNDAKDTIDVYADSVDFRLASKRGKVEETDARKSRILDISAYIDTLKAGYGPSLTVKGRDVSLKMKNDAGIITGTDTSTIFYPMRGDFKADYLSLRDADSTSVGLSGTDNTFRITYNNGNSKIPVLSFTSRNRSARMKAPEGRVFAKNANISLTAEMKTVENKRRREHFLDSLSQVYPGVKRDSLFATMMRNRKAPGPMPAWLKEEDFRKQDLDLKLDESLRKYFMEWGINGSIALSKAKIITPLLPLTNEATNVSATFNNDRINLSSFNFASGESCLSFTGKVTGLKRALLGRGPIKVDAKLVSDRLNCNELLSAYAKGQQFSQENSTTGSTELSDAQFQNAVNEASSVEVDTTASQLFVVPANVLADLAVECYDLEYSNMVIDWLHCNVKMKERCVQIYNTTAAANLGNLFFEGFYATRSKSDIKTGFNLSLIDVTAGEVIQMVPQVSEVVPMISSFDGLLDCEIAGTAALDTNMNVVMPSVDGVMRISGKNLTLAQDEDLRKLTKILRFRNKKELRIDSMSVEGLIKNSELEVFPFILGVDRYKVALSGVQNLDMSFRYHVSVIKSPLLFKFGVDLYGTDFDHLKFKLGKAKYRSEKKIPVFTQAIDESKISLSNAIRNVFETGVEKAVQTTSQQSAIAQQKKKIGYVAAVDETLEPLSEEETQEMDKEETQELDKDENQEMDKEESQELDKEETESENQ